MTDGIFPAVDANQFGDKVTRCIDSALVPFLLGAIQPLLTNPNTYTGDPEDVIETVYQIELLLSDLAGEKTGCNMIGQIVAGVFDAIPDNMLLCDGTAYDCDDYPDLCAVIDSALISGGQFVVPDLRDRTIIGSSTTYPQNTTGGEAQHTLTVDELATHYHPMNVTLSLLGHGGFVPITDVISGVGGTTNLQGGDEPHNNMQPFMALRYYLIAK